MEHRREQNGKKTGIFPVFTGSNYFQRKNDDANDRRPGRLFRQPGLFQVSHQGFLGLCIAD